MLQEQDIPRYRLLRPFYAEDDTLYPTDAELSYTGVPNEDMEPLNEAARQAMIPMLQGIKKMTLGDQVQKAHESLHARDRAAAEPQVIFPKSDKTVPIMPNHVTPGKRQRGRPKKVIDAKVTVPDGRPSGPQKIMGTVILQGQDGAVDTGGGLNQ